MMPNPRFFQVRAGILLVSLVMLLVACQGGPLSQVQVTACDQQAAPVIKQLTSSPSSTRMLYVSVATHLYALNPGNGSLRWCRNFLSDKGSDLSGIGPLALSDGSLYSNSSDERTQAFDAQTGSLRWSYDTQADPSGPPAVTQNVVYSGGFQTIFAMNAPDGSLRWSHQLPQWNSLWNLPVVNNDVLYFESCGYGTQAGCNLYALDAATGAQRWVDRWDAPVRGIDDSPVIDQGVLFINLHGVIQAIDARSGKMLWRYSGFVKQPVVAANGLLLLIDDSESGHSWLRALRVEDGQTIWSLSLKQEYAPLLLVKDVLYVTDGITISALNIQSKQMLWQSRPLVTQDNLMAEPVFFQGTWYVGTMISERKGSSMLYAFNAQSGREEWDAVFPGDPSSHGSMLGIAA